MLKTLAAFAVGWLGASYAIRHENRERIAHADAIFDIAMEYAEQGEVARMDAQALRDEHLIRERLS